MATKSEITILECSITELRRVYDHISNIYDQLRFKALTMIAGEVAIVTFIFAGEAKIQMPNLISLKIFLFTGIISLVIAFGLLVLSIAAGDWHIPGDMDIIEEFDSTEGHAAFLTAMQKDYLETNRMCIKILSRKSIRVNWGLYLLLLGAIIMLVIKYGGSR